jgi:N-acetylglucosamine-6-phosphate deacetylase
MLNRQFLKPPQLLGREAEVPRETDRLQTELSRQIVPIDMDVRRLIRFMAVEIEAVRAASQDGRHELSIPSRDGPVRPGAVNLDPLE